jgi:hypothetical protein
MLSEWSDGPIGTTQIKLIVERLLIDVGEDGDGRDDVLHGIGQVPGRAVHAIGVDVPGRENVVHIVVVVTGQADVVEIVAALSATGGFACLLHGRQQERDENGDDGDHHQQFDEGEGGPSTQRKPGHSGLL